MACWLDNVDLSAPYWEDYRSLLRRLRGNGYPTARRLTRMLPDGCANRRGLPIRFVPAAEPGAVDYEEHVFETGQVSTRSSNRHDLFNALVWCRFPRLKAALNEQHHVHRDCGPLGTRGPRRDALTLLDESGALVVGTDREALRALAARDWLRAFTDDPQLWGEDLQVIVCGHSLLEKLLRPYKSLTAHAVFVHLGDSKALGHRAALRADLDAWLELLLTRSGVLHSPAGLSPLPLMGIPGWWPGGAQNSTFYADASVFRPPPDGFAPATIFSWDRNGDPLLRG